MKKRRLLSIVLALCMVLALMPQMVFADVPTGTPLTKESVSDGTLSLTSGNSYYLSENIEITETINISGTVTLDLNGHVIKMTGGNSVIKVNTHSNFILLDSDSNTGHNGEYASLPTGGVITSDGIPSFGGGVSVDNYGSFTMKGGTIYDCHAISAGGGVFVKDGSFTMEGGVIDDCGAPLGGSVFVEDGRFTMEGGLIDSGNDFASNSISVGYKSTFNANGGVVKSFVELIAQIQNTSTDGCTEFYGLVSNEKNSNSQYIGTISGGIYYGVVRNSGTISGGVFYGGIVNQGGTITEPYHTVSFDLNGASGTAPVTQYFVNTDTAQALEPAAPTREGYEFAGWYTDKELTDLYDFDSKVKENITLYAGFESLTYTVTYDSGEGEGSIEAGTKTHGENFILSSKTFTREGYIQTGWMDENGAEYDLGDTYTEDADVTLYPVWDKIVTLKVPFTTTVKLGGNVSPGETTFDLVVVDANADKESYKDVTAAGSVTTNGAGDYKGNMIFTGSSQQLRAMFCEGAFVQQVNAGEDGWTYDDTVWGLVWQDDIVALASADDATTEYSVNIFLAKYEKSENGIFYSINEGEKPVDNMRFQNTYTKSTTNPSDPEGTTNGDAENADKNAKTGDDTNLALWLALMLLSCAGITGVTVYTRRKRTNE